MGARRIAEQQRQESESKILRYATRNQLRAEVSIWKKRIAELTEKFGEKDDTVLHARWAKGWLVHLAKKLYPEGPNGTARPAEPNG